MTQWDFQNKGKSGWTGTSSFVLEVPLRHLRPSVIYSVQCDRILQRAYCYIKRTYLHHFVSNMTKLYMVPIFPCYPSGIILLRTKAIFYPKLMRRLININVSYILSNRYISYTTIHGTLGAFPCGRTQHVRRMRCSIVSMIQSVFEFRFMHAIPQSRLNGR